MLQAGFVPTIPVLEGSKTARPLGPAVVKFCRYKSIAGQLIAVQEKVHYQKLCQHVVKYSPHGQTFKIKVVYTDDIYTFWHVPIFYRARVARSVSD